MLVVLLVLMMFSIKKALKHGILHIDNSFPGYLATRIPCPGQKHPMPLLLLSWAKESCGNIPLKCLYDLLYFFKYSHRWRVFLTHIGISTERAVDVVIAACTLHNYLRSKLPHFTNNLLDREEADHSFTLGSWRSDHTLESVKGLHGNTSLDIAKKQRDNLCNFVNGVGAVPWQDKMIDK